MSSYMSFYIKPDWSTHTYLKDLWSETIEPLSKQVSINNRTEYIAMDEGTVVFMKRKSNKEPQEDAATSDLFKYWSQTF
jgi:hypothetical protein